MRRNDRDVLSSIKSKLRIENDAIRTAVADAARDEARKGPFQLSGRGHEPRVTLDRRLATILKGRQTPRVFIAGFGANYHYPLRVFEAAAHLLRERLGASPIAVYGSRSAYRVEIPTSTIQPKRRQRILRRTIPPAAEKHL